VSARTPSSGPQLRRARQRGLRLDADVEVEEVGDEIHATLHGDNLGC
jgi:hypothetical protein